MSQLRVGYDVDGVLHHFGNGVREYLSSIGRDYGWKDGKTDGHSWSFYEYWHMTTEEFVEVCHAGVEAGYIFNNHVRPNAVETVQATKDAGHKIIVITDRQFGMTPEASHERTRLWWVESGFPEYDELYFTADKTLAPTDIFVEDKLENYDALTAAGTECWLINRPWNGPRTDGRRRINDIAGYKAKVSTMARDRVLVN